MRLSWIVSHQGDSIVSDDAEDKLVLDEPCGHGRSGEEPAEPLGPLAVEVAAAEGRLGEILGEIAVERGDVADGQQVRE